MKVPVRVKGVPALAKTQFRFPALRVVLAEIVSVPLTTIFPVPVELVVIVSEVPVKVSAENVHTVPTATLVPKFLASPTD